MQIINPLYDKAFKYLMQNERLAKKVLSVILDTEIYELNLSQQETVVPDEKRNLTLFRLDFKAIIRTQTGEPQKVLIELQKSKYITDIQRFRNYLGSNYMKSETEKTENEVEIKKSYPIITIYILGYPIEDIPYLAVSIDKKIINSVNKQEIQLQSEFVNKLTHVAHVLQVRRLPEKRQTKLENFLVLFNQAWCTEKKYILDLHEISEEFSDIAKYLQTPVMDNNFRQQLEAEEEIDTIFDNQESKYLRQIEEIKQEKEEAIKREDEAIKREDEERKQKEEAKIKLAKKMKKYGEPIEEIIKETGLIKEDIEKL